jgi:SSS family solute:Na+ symporter
MTSTAASSRKGRTEAHYVMVGRLVTALLMVLAAGLTFVLDSARQSFELLMSIGAGTGLLYLLRWFWWRVSAWCEIAAMVTSFLIALGFFVAGKAGMVVPSHITLIVGVVITTAVWVTTAYLAPPTDSGKLDSFYALVRPAGPGWKVVRDRTGLPASADSLPMAMLGWVLGCAFVYAALFGAGSFLYGNTAQALVWLGVFVVSTVGLARILPKIWRSSES